MSNMSTLPHNNNEELSGRLSELIASRRGTKTTKEISEKWGIPHWTITRLESNYYRRLRSELKTAIAEALGLSIEEVEYRHQLDIKHRAEGRFSELSPTRQLLDCRIKDLDLAARHISGDSKLKIYVFGGAKLVINTEYQEFLRQALQRSNVELHICWFLDRTDFVTFDSLRTNLRSIARTDYETNVSHYFVAEPGFESADIERQPLLRRLGCDPGNHFLVNQDDQDLYQDILRSRLSFGFFEVRMSLPGILPDPFGTITLTRVCSPSVTDYSERYESFLLDRDEARQLDWIAHQMLDNSQPLHKPQSS